MENTKKTNKLYVDWLNCKKFSQQAISQLLRLSPLYVKQSFVESKMKFGTAGIRAKIGPGTNKINALTYEQMTEGYARHLLKMYDNNPSKISVVVAHDNRENADKFSRICADVLTSFGIKVYLYKDNELMATPIVSFTIIDQKLQGAIIATASHNPKDYLGFKVYNETGGQIITEEEQDIYNLMPSPDRLVYLDYKKNDNLINYLDESIISRYYEKAKTCLISTDVSKEKDFPIVFTAHHGTASKRMPEFLATLNYSNVIPVKEQCVVDPYFTHSPTSNPEEKASFKLAIDYAEKNSCDILLGVDPDADRLAVVVKHEGQWFYLTGNETGIIFSYYLLKNKNFGSNPFIVSTYVSTNLIDRIAAKYNTQVARTPTGFKWLGAEITKRLYSNQNFVVAFEEAIGSLNSTINRDKDSFQAAALILEIYGNCRKEHRTLIDLLEKEIYPEFGFWAGETVAYLISGANWQEKISFKFNELKKMKLEQYCNVKIIESKWNEPAQAIEWILENNMYIKFRMSGTEPKFKVYYNVYGNSVANANEILEMFKKETDKLIKNL